MFSHDEEFLQAIVDAVPSVLMVVAEDLTVRLCNTACEEFTGEPRQTIIGAKMTNFIHDESLLDQVRSAISQTLVKTSDMVMQVGANGNLAVRTVITPITQSRDGRLCLLRLEDKTERVITEHKLARAEKRAEELRLLARSMAHELGNPMAIIRVTMHYLANMLPHTNDDAAHQAMAVISDSVDHVDDLLRQLSDFAASQKPEFKAVDLRYLIRKTISLVDFDAQSQSIVIRQEVDEDLPSCECDPTALRALMLNLIRNAMESMPTGGEIHVKAYSSPSQDTGGSNAVHMVFQDNGPGINEEYLLNLFRPFFTTKPNGRGLGLSFCKRVAEEHGGAITLDTECREGTRFVVSLPLQREVNAF